MDARTKPRSRFYSKPQPKPFSGRRLALPRRLLRGKRARVQAALFAGVFCLSALVCGGASIALYRNYAAQYRHDLALAQQGMQHFKTAQMLLKGLLQNPFDTAKNAQARQALAQSSALFSQVEQDLKQIPAAAALVPHYGALLSAGLRAAPMAVDFAQAGMVGCDMLALLGEKLRDPLTPQATGLTMADLATLNQQFAQLQQHFTAAVAQLNQMQPSDMQVEPSLASAVTAFRAALPALQQGLASLKTALAIAPAFLGVQQPANYLIEVLDSTELRPGGGFIGNYGVLTLAGGRVSHLFITDVDLLDYPFAAAGNTIAFPANYQWFKLVSNWSLRDSNLDADFPTAARYGEQNYHTEGGTAPLQGVIALTPWFMQDLLKITGPIYVSEYQETITAENLVERIHYHQLGPNHGSAYIPDPGGHSSQRKKFTELLFEHVMARVQRISTTHASALMQLFVSALATKDIQLYFNDPKAEAVLESYHVASTIQAPPNDSLMVVAANITGNKANQFMTYTMRDEVTLDSSGNAVHHLTLTYIWPYSAANLANDYGNKTFYKDYLRVYVPPGSILQSQAGWVPQGTSTAFGREVWAGLIYIAYKPGGSTKTITLTWTVPKAAKKTASGWQYRYLVQRQAGVTWQQNLHITLPTCAKIVGKPGGFTMQAPQQAAINQPLTRDTTFALDYRCSA